MTNTTQIQKARDLADLIAEDFGEDSPSEMDLLDYLAILGYELREASSYHYYDAIVDQLSGTTTWVHRNQFGEPMHLQRQGDGSFRLFHSDAADVGWVNIDVTLLPTSVVVSNKELVLNEREWAWVLDVVSAAREPVTQ